MSYLERLRQPARLPTAGGGAPTKPTKVGSDGFVGEAPPPVGSCAASNTVGSGSHAPPRRIREAAKSAGALDEFREALIIGRLHVCANCERYSFAAEPIDVGICRLHGEALPFAVFECQDFTLAAYPSAPAYAPVSPFVTPVAP